MPKTISDAKRLMAVASAEAAQRLGAGVSRPCSQARYNLAAAAALADADADFSKADRILIASFIVDESDEEPRSFMLRVRLTEAEREQLQEMADTASMDMSEYTRFRLFEQQ